MSFCCMPHDGSMSCTRWLIPQLRRCTRRAGLCTARSCLEDQKGKEATEGRCAADVCNGTYFLFLLLPIDASAAKKKNKEEKRGTDGINERGVLRIHCLNAGRGDTWRKFTAVRPAERGNTNKPQRFINHTLYTARTAAVLCMKTAVSKQEHEENGERDGAEDERNKTTSKKEKNKETKEALGRRGWGDVCDRRGPAVTRGGRYMKEEGVVEGIKNEGPSVVAMRFFFLFSTLFDGQICFMPVFYLFFIVNWGCSVFIFFHIYLFIHSETVKRIKKKIYVHVRVCVYFLSWFSCLPGGMPRGLRARVL
ncbi:hypothetical protein TCSYLVIO_000879 [Trypanosoma cruzi]|nr:hypothetical protein TCSYLVIO_000879 [Trypanosoma cruzi]